MGLFDQLFGRRDAFEVVTDVALEGHPVGLAFTAGDRKLVALTGEGTVVVVDIAQRASPRRTEVHTGGALSLAAHASRPRIATGGMDGRVAFLDATSGALEREQMLAPGGWIEHLLWWEDTLVAAHGRTVSLIAPDGSTRRLGPHASTVAGLSLGRGARGEPALAVARFGGLDVHPLGRDEPPRTLAWSSSLVSVAWSPDGRFVAAGCQDNALHFWRMPSGDDSMMGGYPGKPKVIAWSPASDALATAGAEDVVVWSFRGAGPEGTTPLELRAHARSVTALAWSPDGRLLASGARDGDCCVHDGRREGPPLVRLELGGTVAALAFSGDGRWLAAASSEGLLRLVRR
ncbi:MAG: hypothetical protein OHK0013_36210 [Sandaracinaceae bacterium]